MSREAVESDVLRNLRLGVGARVYSTALNTGF
jgi:hypothetical protein